MTTAKRVCVVYGAPTPPGRLATATGALSEMLARRGAEVRSLDLHQLAAELVRAPVSETMQRALDDVAWAEAVVFTSPVYRASYPGVLKCLLDLLPVDALKFKPVGLVVMGGSAHHYLGVDRHIRDVAAWFGAIVNPTSVYLTGSSFTDDGRLREEPSSEIDALAAS